MQVVYNLNATLPFCDRLWFRDGSAVADVPEAVESFGL